MRLSSLFDFRTKNICNTININAPAEKIYLAKLLQEGKFEQVMEDLNVSTPEEAKAYLERFGVNAEHVEIWGSGAPRREFLYSEDMADACVFIMEKIDFKDLIVDKNEIRNTHINIGTGEDISIQELAQIIQKILGYKGQLLYNTSKPDGTMIKLSDPSKLHQLGWKHKVGLEEGIVTICQLYKFLS